MINYLKGKITKKENNFIIVEVNDIGYLIYISKNANFTVGEIVTVYTYTIFKDDGDFLMGFSSLEERNAFELLISVQGIGPKTALTILGNTTPELLLTAIKTGDRMYLQYIPGVGQKNASQILLDLSGHISKTKTALEQHPDIYASLKAMGFKAQSIKTVLSSITDSTFSKEDILKIALSKLR